MFMNDIKAKADPDDHSQINYLEFLNILKTYGVVLQKKELIFLHQAFPGNNKGGDGKAQLNISRMFEIHYINRLKNMYKQIDISASVGNDEPTDELGYHGKTRWHRSPVGKLNPISEEEFLEVVKKEQFKLTKSILLSTRLTETIMGISL